MIDSLCIAADERLIIKITLYDHAAPSLISSCRMIVMRIRRDFHIKFVLNIQCSGIRGKDVCRRE